MNTATMPTTPTTPTIHCTMAIDASFPFAARYPTLYDGLPKLFSPVRFLPLTATADGPTAAPSPMPLLGAHQSIAGGYYRAVELAAEIGCDCVQLFTKNNNQWRAKPLTVDDATKFQAALKKSTVSHSLAHDSYLINLAAPDEDLWRKSLEAFAIELLRA